MRDYLPSQRTPYDTVFSIHEASQQDGVGTWDLSWKGNSKKDHFLVSQILGSLKHHRKILFQFLKWDLFLKIMALGATLNVDLIHQNLHRDLERTL